MSLEPQVRVRVPALTDGNLPDAMPANRDTTQLEALVLTPARASTLAAMEMVLVSLRLLLLVFAPAKKATLGTHATVALRALLATRTA